MFRPRWACPCLSSDAESVCGRCLDRAVNGLVAEASAICVDCGSGLCRNHLVLGHRERAVRAAEGSKLPWRNGGAGRRAAANARPPAPGRRPNPGRPHRNGDAPAGTAAHRGRRRATDLRPLADPDDHPFVVDARRGGPDRAGRNRKRRGPAARVPADRQLLVGPGRLTADLPRPLRAGRRRRRRPAAEPGRKRSRPRRERPVAVPPRTHGTSSSIAVVKRPRYASRIPTWCFSPTDTPSNVCATRVPRAARSPRR